MDRSRAADLLANFNGCQPAEAAAALDAVFLGDPAPMRRFGILLRAGDDVAAEVARQGCALGVWDRGDVL